MNKVEIGLSVYPQFHSISECKKQIQVAFKLGYTRLFTSLLLENLGFLESHVSLDDYRELTQYAHAHHFLVHADINREIFEELGADISDLSSLKDFGIDVLRLDSGFSEEETIQLTLNQQGIIIEDNPISHESVYTRARSILKDGNPKQFRYCHNFFPRNNTGLDFDETEMLTQEFNEMGYSCGIFITSQSSPSDLNSYSEGVCTIEDHRYKPAHIAFQELRNTGVYDIIIFGDSYPDYKTLKSVADAQKRDYCLIDAWIDKDCPEEIKHLLTETLHINRFDISADVIRSTQTRKKVAVEPYQCIERKVGMITIDNELAERYEGEMQIVLKDLSASKMTNVAGMVKPTCKRLLKQVKYSGILFMIKE